VFLGERGELDAVFGDSALLAVTTITGGERGFDRGFAGSPTPPISSTKTSMPGASPAPADR